MSLGTPQAPKINKEKKSGALVGSFNVITGPDRSHHPYPRLCGALVYNKKKYVSVCNISSLPLPVKRLCRSMFQPLEAHRKDTSCPHVSRKKCKYNSQQGEREGYAYPGFGPGAHEFWNSGQEQPERLYSRGQ